VDKLDLSALTDLTNQLTIAPSLTIYYAKVLTGFTPPIDPDTGLRQEPEEYLDGAFNGHLRWVRSYAGANSSTPVVVVNPANGQQISIQVNSALRNSEFIESDGKTPNYKTPMPFLLADLNVITNGNGTVLPNSGITPVIIGVPYSVTASPGDGSTFSGWTGSVVSASPQLTFAVTNGITNAYQVSLVTNGNPGLILLSTNHLSLTANFVAVPSAGTYSGLFSSGANVVVGQSGALTLTRTTSGKFSGQVQLGSKSSSFTGLFNAQGKCTVPVSSLKVVLNLQAGAQHITGTVAAANGAWTANLTANLDPFSSNNNPSPYQGTYTLLFPGASDPASTTVPQGYGSASISVSSSGLLTLSGALADGTTISGKSMVAGDGTWPLFISLYSGKGELFGWQDFTSTGFEDAGGSFSWIKLAGAGGKLYPAGFTVATNDFGSVFNPQVQPVTSFSSGFLELVAGDLSQGITNSISVSTANVITNLGPNKLSLKLGNSGKNGLFTGTITEPGNHKTINFSGALDQKLGYGAGSFQGSTQSGSVTLSPNP
jgi:hypothetical protein